MAFEFLKMDDFRVQVVANTERDVVTPKITEMSYLDLLNVTATSFYCLKDRAMAYFDLHLSISR